MSDNFKYTAGLNNVGSYQVSGKPFVTASTISDGTEQQVQFPHVTNNITVKNNGVRSCLQIDNSDSSGGSNPFILNFSSSGPEASDGDARTITCWFSSSGTADPNNNFNVIGTVDDVTNGMCIRESGGQFKAFMKDDIGNGKLSAGIGAFLGGWTLLTFRVQSANFQLNINNGDAVNSKNFAPGRTSGGEGLGTGLKIGPNGNRQMDSKLNYRDCVLWSSYLTDAQIDDIYNNSNDTDSQWYRGTGIFSSTTKLNWMKPTGSVGLVPSTLKNHGSNSYSDFALVGSSSGDFVQIFEDAPYLIPNELRVHYRSTGSSNVATNKHYWTLDSQNESITMNVKSKEIYLSSDGGDCDYSLQADLTSIPSSRMYQHTGSGVDE